MSSATCPDHRSKYVAGCPTCRRHAADIQAAWVARSKERIASGDDSHVPHGTLNGYSNYGCRCEACRAVWSSMCREYRARRVGSLAAGSPLHGRPSTRRNYGCRCDACRYAEAVSERQRLGRLAKGFRTVSDVTLPEAPQPKAIDVMSWLTANSTESVKALTEGLGYRINVRSYLPARARGTNGWSTTDLDRLFPPLFLLGDVQRAA